LPQGLQRIDAPTPFVWVIGRTRTDGPQDYDAVHKIQDAYKITLLSQWAKEPQTITPKIDTSVDMETPPVQQVKNMAPDAYFAYAAELLKVNAPHATDQPQLARLKRLGFDVGRSFDPANVNPLIRQALQTAPAVAEKALIAQWPKVGRKANGWVMNTDSGVYGANYLKRATIARFEIGMNLPEDAIYPDTADTPLDGRNKYVIHFEKGALPPVEEFWSVTIYDLEGFTVPTPTNRYTLGDRSNLKPNAGRRQHPKELERACHQLLHDLVSAPVNLLHARGSVHAGDRVFEHVAIAAEHLKTAIDDFALLFRGPILGH
jgi:hypothetical protein